MQFPRFRFGIKTLLALVTLVALCLGFYAHLRQQYWNQKQVVKRFFEVNRPDDSERDPYLTVSSLDLFQEEPYLAQLNPDHSLWQAIKTYFGYTKKNDESFIFLNLDASKLPKGSQRVKIDFSPLNDLRMFKGCLSIRYENSSGQLPQHGLHHYFDLSGINNIASITRLSLSDLSIPDLNALHEQQGYGFFLDLKDNQHLSEIDVDWIFIDTLNQRTQLLMSEEEVKKNNLELITSSQVDALKSISSLRSIDFPYSPCDLEKISQLTQLETLFIPLNYSEEDLPHLFKMKDLQKIYYVKTEDRPYLRENMPWIREGLQ